MKKGKTYRHTEKNLGLAGTCALSCVVGGCLFVSGFPDSRNNCIN